jgi:hypothetical protein
VVKQKRKLSYREKREREAAWLRRADEVLEEYGDGNIVAEPRPEPPNAA